MNNPSIYSGRIVVGIDGSDHSTRALRVAAVLAQALKHRLHVIGCWSRPDVYLAAQIPVDGFPDRDPMEWETARLVTDAVERVFGLERPRGLITGIRYGHPAQILVQESARARLLVVGRRGQGGFLGLRLGSVSSACIAHAHCPILIVNSQE